MERKRHDFPALKIKYNLRSQLLIEILLKRFPEKLIYIVLF